MGASYDEARAPLNQYRSQLPEATEALNDGLQIPAAWIPRMLGQSPDRDGEGLQLGCNRLG